MIATELDHNAIARILPQAYPFVMIDRVVEFKKGESLTAVKNITANEWPFAAPARESTVFPETLLIEAAAQAGLLLYHLSKIKDGTQRPRYIVGRAKADFRNFVFIGDQIHIKAFANKMMETGGYSDIEITRGSDAVVQIEMMYSVVR